MNFSTADEGPTPAGAKLPYPRGYAISKRWRETLANATRQARLLRNGADVAKLGMTLFDLPPDVVDAKRAEFFRARRDGFVSRHPELAKIGESNLADPASVAVINGVPFSAKMDQVFTYYEDIKAGVGDAHLKTIVEVGAGYGRLARAMHLLGTKRFVLVDLPEALAFSYAFLRLSFPQARLKLASDGEDADFIFCPIQEFGRLDLGPVDLVVNTYSLAEMPQTSVNFIVDCIERVIQPLFFYSLNMVFTDKTVHYDTGGLDGEANETVLPLRPQWTPRRFVLIPSMYERNPRITGSVVLEHAAARLSTDDVGSLYLKALWSRDRNAAEVFFSRLRDTLSEFDHDVYFDRIGEVAFIRRGLQDSRLLHQL